MTFEALTKRHLDGIKSGPLGQSIGYRKRTDAPCEFSSINAIYDREEVDVFGNVIRQTLLELWVSKTDVPSVSIGKDQFKVTTAEGDQVYVVSTVVEEDVGAWHLRCVQ